MLSSAEETSVLVCSLEKLKGKDMSAYELCKLLEHKLKHTICNLNYNEAEHFIKVIKDYQIEWEARHGVSMAPTTQRRALDKAISTTQS